MNTKKFIKQIRRVEIKRLIENAREMLANGDINAEYIDGYSENMIMKESKLLATKVYIDRLFKARNIFVEI